MNILITGANRGLGLGLTHLYLKNNHTVFATARHPESAEELKVLQKTWGDKIAVFTLDLESDESIAEFTNRLKNVASHIDILIHNAGVYHKDEHLSILDRKHFLETFHANVFGPIILTKSLFSVLKSSKNPKVAIVSSQMGALTMHAPGSYSYRSSKAAVNMLAKVLADEVETQGISVCTIHPGWVQTEMGGRNAMVSVEDSASGVSSVIESLSLQTTGRFFTWQGDEHPW